MQKYFIDTVWAREKSGRKKFTPRRDELFQIKNRKSHVILNFNLFIHFYKSTSNPAQSNAIVICKYVVKSLFLFP